MAIRKYHTRTPRYVGNVNQLVKPTSFILKEILVLFRCKLWDAPAAVEPMASTIERFDDASKQENFEVIHCRNIVRVTLELLRPFRTYAALNVALNLRAIFPSLIVFTTASTCNVSCFSADALSFLSPS